MRKNMRKQKWNQDRDDSNEDPYVIWTKTSIMQYCQNCQKKKKKKKIQSISYCWRISFIVINFGWIIILSYGIYLMYFKAYLLVVNYNYKVYIVANYSHEI